MPYSHQSSRLLTEMDEALWDEALERNTMRDEYGLEVFSISKYRVYPLQNENLLYLRENCKDIRLGTPCNIGNEGSGWGAEYMHD